MAEQDTAALADIERVVSFTIRFMADGQSGRRPRLRLLVRAALRLKASACVFAALTSALS
ncbi:hypothetical protein [Methylorubrum aminovorans]